MSKTEGPESEVTGRVGDTPKTELDGMDGLVDHDLIEIECSATMSIALFVGGIVRLYRGMVWCGAMLRSRRGWRVLSWRLSSVAHRLLQMRLLVMNDAVPERGAFLVLFLQNVWFAKQHHRNAAYSNQDQDQLDTALLSR